MLLEFAIGVVTWKCEKSHMRDNPMMDGRFKTNYSDFCLCDSLTKPSKHVGSTPSAFISGASSCVRFDPRSQERLQ